MTAKKTRDYCAIAADYAARVLDGSQLACKWVKLACQRQRDDLKRWKEGGPFPFLSYGTRRRHQGCVGLSNS